MRTLLLLGLAALALASTRIPNHRWLEEAAPTRQIQDMQFQAGREYQFVYNGQLLTGVPQSSKQHSATRIQALCSLVFKGDTRCLLQCTHLRMGKLNGKVVEPRKMIPFEAFEEVPIEPELKQQLHAPVKFTYQQGLISDIVFDGIEQPWSANIKRGVLNMIQVNLAQRGRTDRTDDAVLRNEVPESENLHNNYFSSMEKTLEGECECDYTVTNQPGYGEGQSLNITKSVNFEKCRRRPDIKYNYRFSTPCPSCEKKYTSEEKMVRSSTVTKYHITGTPEQFLINKVVCDSQYNYVAMTEKTNVVTTYVKQKLVLIHTGPVFSGIKEPSNPQPSDSQMIFTPDWDLLKERFFQEGEETFHQETPYSEITNKVEFVGQILRRLVRCVSDSVEECAPRQFVRLVKVLRMCKLDEIKQIHRSFYKTTPSSFTPEDHKKIKDLLVDALTIAGTKDTISHFVEKVKQREIHPIKASLSIKNLINVRVPSKQMVEKLMKLSEHEVCRRSPFLRQSVMLTCGSLINALCGDHQDKLAQQFKQHQMCPRQLKLEYTETLFRKLSEAQTTPEKVLYLKTISNAGLDLSVLKLEQIIKNTGSQAPHNTLVRSEAILALRRLRGTMPRKIQKMLMPVFMNERQLPEIRMVAIYQIMQTLPERPVLDQITRQLFKERSRQVGSFVLSQLQSLANSTNPCEKRVADDLKLSLRRAKSQPFARLSGYSKLYQLRSYSRKYDRDLSLDLGLVTSQNSYMPKVMAATLNLNSHNLWLKHLLSVGITQKGGHQWIRDAYSQRGYFEREFDEVLRRSPRSIKTQSPQNELKRIFKILNIADRYSTEQNPIVMPYLKFKDQDMGFLPISPETIPESVREMVQNDRLDIQSIENLLENGINMDFHQAWMLHEQSRKIPTSLGLPMRTTLKLPVIMKVTGQIKGQMEPQDKLRMVKLIVNIKPSMAITASAKMESWCPVVNSGLKIIGQVNLFAPINGEFKIDARKTPVDTQLIWKPHPNPYQLIKAQTLPLTYTVVWPKSLKNWQEPEERTIYGEEWNRVKNIDYQFGENALGIKVHTHGSYHRTPEKSVSGTPYCPYSGPNKVQVTVRPGHQMPKEVVLKVSGKMFNQLKKGMKPEFENFYDSQDESYFGTEYKPEYNEFETSSPINNQLLVKIFTRGSSIKRNAELKTNCRCDDRQKHCKCDLELKRSPVPQIESGIWKFTGKAEMFYPDTPYRLSELSQDKTYLNQLKATWGVQGSQKKEVEVKIQGRRSPRQVELLERERHYYRSECSSPICQYQVLKQAAILTDYKIDVDYNLGKYEQNLTNKVYRWFKHNYYYQTSVNQINVNNPQNQIRSRITIDPKNRQYVNVTIETPKEKSKFRDIPLPMKVNPVNIRTRSSRVRSPSEWLQRMVEPTMGRCEVRPGSIKTFDGLRTYLPFSQCYSVLAKDCSQSDNSRFVVMAKKVSGSKKQVKIISEQTQIVLRKEQGEIKVKVDGSEMPCPQYKEVQKHNHVVARIQKDGPYCKVSLPEAGIKVYYDGYACDIKMSKYHQNMQCGLCGHYDGEVQPEREFLNSQFQYVDSLPQFHRSYLIQENCELESDIDDISKYSYSIDDQQERTYQPNWRSTKSGSCPQLGLQNVIEGTCQEECSGDNKCSGNKKCCFNGCGHVCTTPSTVAHGDRRRQPVRRTKVIEQGSEICFSKEPVPKCPPGTYPKYDTERSVVYSCLSRSGSDGQRAERYHRQSHQYKVVPEVSDLPASFTQTEAIPKSCVPY